MLACLAACRTLPCAGLEAMCSHCHASPPPAGQAKLKAEARQKNAGFSHCTTGFHTGLQPLTQTTQTPNPPNGSQLAKLKAEAEAKALAANAARAVVTAAQQAQREGRLLSSKDIQEIR